MPRHFHHNQPPTKTAATSQAIGPKPKLAMVQLPIFRVHYRRLEEYLAKVYQMEGFDFLKASGITPGMVPEYGISAALPPSHDAQRRADAIRTGRRTHDVPMILTTLCADGFIPAGKYIIDTRREQSAIDQYRTILRQTGTPESKECIDFQQVRRGDKAFIRLAAEIDNQVLAVLHAQNQK